MLYTGWMDEIDKVLLKGNVNLINIINYIKHDYLNYVHKKNKNYEKNIVNLLIKQWDAMLDVFLACFFNILGQQKYCIHIDIISKIF